MPARCDVIRLTDARNQAAIYSREEGLGQSFPPDLAAEIAGCLLAIDLTECIAFRAVCAAMEMALSTNLAGAAAECTICLAELADGDAVRAMPACRHSFHASCIERWLAGGRRSSTSCPTCRAPAAVATAAAAAARSGDGDCAKHVAFVILAALQMIALVLALLDGIVRHFREGK